MIRINLLPYRAARKKENVRTQFNIFIGSLILVGLAIFYFNSHLSGRIKGLNNEIGEVRAQVAKYQEINKEISEIKAKLSIITQKIEVIESLERDRKAPVENLDDLYSLLVEKRMWYTQIEEKGNDFRISGVAIDNQTVADYMTRLDKSNRFHNVKLISTKQYTFKGTDLLLKQFDINFEVQSTTKDDPESKKE